MGLASKDISSCELQGHNFVTLLISFSMFCGFSSDGVPPPKRCFAPHNQDLSRDNTLNPGNSLQPTHLHQHSERQMNKNRNKGIYCGKTANEYRYLIYESSFLLL